MQPPDDEVPQANAVRDSEMAKEVSLVRGGLFTEVRRQLDS